jgi:hypothetical protein
MSTETETGHAQAPPNPANPKPFCLCGQPWPCAVDVTLPIAEELAWLSGYAGALAVSPESFDLEGLMPRFQRAVDALYRVLEVAGKHEHNALRWQDPLLVPPWVPEVREAISAALLTRETPEPCECPQCHCLFERAGMDHEPCGAQPGETP